MVKDVHTATNYFGSNDRVPTEQRSANLIIRQCVSNWFVNNEMFYECVKAIHKTTYSGCITRDDAKRFLYYKGISVNSRFAIADQVHSMKSKEMLFKIGFIIGSTLGKKVRFDFAEEDKRSEQAFRRWEDGRRRINHLVPVKYTVETPMHICWLGVSDGLGSSP